MLPWEAKARTLEAPVDDVLPLLGLLYHESDVANATAGYGPDDYYVDEYDSSCPVCRSGGARY